MALQTKTITANGSKGHHVFTLIVNEDSTNIETNKSSGTYTFQNGVKKTYTGSYELNALKKFALLPNITIFEEGELIKVDKERDEGYSPTLYYYNKSYQLAWINDENNSICNISGDTPEEVINKAFNFCINENLI